MEMNVGLFYIIIVFKLGKQTILILISIILSVFMFYFSIKICKITCFISNFFYCIDSYGLNVYVSVWRN